MSRYTTQLRYPLEQHLRELGLDASEDGWPKIYEYMGLHDYPIFDEKYRTTLNDKIIRAFWFREIGFETWGQFVWQMRRTMHEIMPYYNQLYESTRIVIDPLLTRDMDYEETWTRKEDVSTITDGTENRTSSGRSEGEGSTSSHDRNVFQDTPMNGLDTGAVEGADYATNVTFDDGSTSSSNSSTTDSSTDLSAKTDRSEDGRYDGTKRHREKGFDSDQSKLLLTYRKTFVNIDLEVIGELSSLFMKLW